MSDIYLTARSARLLLGAIASVLLFLMAAQLAAQTSATKARVDYCVSCHQDLDDAPTSPASLESKSVHRHAGFSCSDCHGGNPSTDDAEAAMSPASGFIGAPTAQTVASFCGRCHSDPALMKRFDPATRIDQQAEYASSGHGRTLAKGDTKAATCISCHGSHGILKADDANAPVHPLNVATTCGRCHGDKNLMSAYGVFTDQVEHYRKSVHATALYKKQDLSAPTCNDCHGNHGAAPPGVDNVANVCGTCHVRQSDLYTASAHEAPFRDGGIAGCIACHNDHEITKPTDEHLGTGPKSMCTSCHAEGDKGYRMADQLRASLQAMEFGIARAERVLGRASTAGMEVSRSEFELRDARDKLINARVLVHGVSAAMLDSLVTSSQQTAERAEKAGIAALQELNFRRDGLSISLIVIIIAAIAVYVKVRQIERVKRNQGVLAGATNGSAKTPLKS